MRKADGRRQSGDLRRREDRARRHSRRAPWPRRSSPKNRKQKRPNVQVGDPFMEKLLLEACLEAMQTGAVVGIQDMGAAGLTCSTCEMGARGGVGHRDRTGSRAAARNRHDALRDHALANRRSACCWWPRRAAKRKCFAVFQKWGLDAVDRRRGHRRRHAARAGARQGGGGNSRTHALADEAPLYNRPHGALGAAGAARECRSTWYADRRRRDLTGRSQAAAGVARHLLQALDLASSTTPWCAPTPWQGPGRAMPR